MAPFQFEAQPVIEAAQQFKEADAPQSAGEIEFDHRKRLQVSSP